MRNREEILKNFIDFGSGLKKMAVWDERQRASLVNPKLQLEVLLDIRDLLIEIQNKLKSR